MDKAILVIDMPRCCYECFAFDDSGDHPMCLVTEECRGYKFRAREEKMDKCPLKQTPEKYDLENILYTSWIEEYKHGYNDCVDEILGK